jgi:putative ABC transport system substrate-binding protein
MLHPRAQPSTKVPRVGFLSASTRAAQLARLEAFRTGLRDLGYVEGQTVQIDWRFDEGRSERVPELRDVRV